MKKTITKIFAGLLCVVLCGSMLCGCGMYTDPDYQSYKEEQQVIKEEAKVKADCFEIVHKEAEYNENTGVHMDYIFIYREKRTDVLYVQYSGYRSETMTVMLAPDGTPLLYSEWVEMGK